jgi:hypothetical protein
MSDDREQTPQYLFAKYCRKLNADEHRTLVKRDVMPCAIGWCNDQWELRMASVVWEGELWFQFGTERDGGKDAAIIVCLGADGQPADLAAWSLSENRIALHKGAVSMIGEEQLGLPRVGDDKLWVHPSPVEWLAHRRVGVVVVNYDQARAALVAASPLAVKTRAQKLELEERWRMPRIQVFDVAEAIAS